MNQQELEKIIESSIKQALSEKEYFSEGLASGVLKFFGATGLTIAAFYVLKYIIKKCLMDPETVKVMAVAMAPRLNDEMQKVHQRQMRMHPPKAQIIKTSLTPGSGEEIRILANSNTLV